MIRTRVLSLMWEPVPTCRIVLSRQVGNVIWARIFRVKAKDVPKYLWRQHEKTC